MYLFECLHVRFKLPRSICVCLVAYPLFTSRTVAPRNDLRSSQMVSWAKFPSSPRQESTQRVRLVSVWVHVKNARCVQMMYTWLGIRADAVFVPRMTCLLFPCATAYYMCIQRSFVQLPLAPLYVVTLFQRCVSYRAFIRQLCVCFFAQFHVSDVLRTRYTMP